MTSPSKPFRLLSCLWTSVCVGGVLTLSMALVVAQQLNNDTLPAALDTQASELLGVAK